MLHVPLGNLDEVGNEIVASFELDFDLRESVLESIAQRDQSVVDSDTVEQQQHADNYDDRQDSPGRHVNLPSKRGQ